ncbi:UNVERIFIED_CONTAM: hypothetical protein Sindi_0054300 [Sesamum indicum]
MFTVFLSHESWGRRIKFDLIDGSGLTPSNTIHLKSSESCEEVGQRILGISWDENSIVYLPRGFCHVNCKSRAWKIRSWIPSPLENIVPETPLKSGGLSLIVLDFENQDYVLDKPLPTALLEGSSPEKRVTFDKWLEDNRINAIPDRHIRYVAINAFFGTKVVERSFVQNHGVKMLSLMEKLEDLEAGLNNDTYIDMILQSFPRE